MFAIPGVLILILLICVRPFEFVPAARSLPILYLAFGLTILGFAIDLRQRRSRLELLPHTAWVLLFYAWCMLTLLINARAAILINAWPLAIPVLLFLIISHCVQTFRAFHAVVVAVLACVVFLSIFGIIQGRAPNGCLEINPADPYFGTADGRPCEELADCYDNDPDPGKHYMCERVGLFGVSSTGDRVRYLGTLGDPNNLALVICLGMPLAVALFSVRRSLLRLILLALVLGLGVACVIFTKSRTGQLVFATVLFVFFARRMGWKGVVLGVALSLPAMLLGGRDTAEAEGSAAERMECWYEALMLFRHHPIFGVGQGQFREYFYLTAHNSYLLTAAELGFAGLVIWSTVLYLSAKIPLQAIRRYAPSSGSDPNAFFAVTWATALLAMFIGLLIGIGFLSLAYHQVMWIYLGLTGAFYGVLRTHDTSWRVRFGRIDLLLVAVIDIALLIAFQTYYHLGHE